MKLLELLGQLVADEQNIGAMEISGISQNSREIVAGDLFLACAGSRGTHGIAYAGEAAKNGAVAIIWEPTEELQNMPEQFVVQRETSAQEKYEQWVPLIRLGNLHELAGEIAARFYAKPTAQMNIIGITGTNGKTSISYFVAQSIDSQQACGVLGTLGNGIFDHSYRAIKESSHTTADAVSIQAMMATMQEQGAQHVVMEVSSHALDQGRVLGVNFDLAIFTNLSRDHLDYHGDLESYAKAKRKLFLSQSLDAAIINQNDMEGRYLIAALEQQKKKVISYAISHTGNLQQAASVYAKNIQSLLNGSLFDLCIGAKQQQIKLALLGEFNISNALATAGVMLAMNYDFETIVARLQELKSVPGRMEVINVDLERSQALLIVDYAHTPDALEQALKAIQSHVKASDGSKIWCVFGCGGNRDKGKRQLMGEIACNTADQIVLTNDNPRDEEPRAIVEDIEQGIKAEQVYHVELDRSAAIKLAIQSAHVNDVILVAGKGHESYQEIKGVRNYYSDQQVIREIIAG